MASPSPRPGPPTAVVVGAAAVLAGLVVAAVRPPWEFGRHGLFAGDGPPPAQAPELRPPTATPAPLPVPPVAGDGWAWLPWVLLLAATAGLVVLLIRWWRRRPASRPREERPPETVPASMALEPDLPTLRQGAVTAEERLLAIGNPTDAIVAAWLALEDAAGESGVARPPAATPTEFTADVLQRTGAPARPVQDLLGLYLRVRFGSRAASGADLEVARRCVRDLAEHWSVFAVGPGTPPGPVDTAPRAGGAP